MGFIYGVDSDKKREELLNSSKAKRFIDEVIAKADTAISEISPAFKMSEYMLFEETGNRTIFEKGYFERRNKCFSILIAFWLTKDEKYIKPLVDYITYISDEFTWCLPAHAHRSNNTVEGIIEEVDLFQSETARLFSEIVAIVGDKLPDYTKERMKYEIERRIFAGFKKGRSFEWETWPMNWVTVCGAGVFAAALYFGNDEDKEFFYNRCEPYLSTYLLGIEDDGCCQEGLSYWGYGFSHFVILAELIKEYSKGKVDYFKQDKVKELALFPQRVRLSKSKVASISDGGEEFSFKMGLLCYLKNLYPEVTLPSLEFGTYYGNVYSVSEFLWFFEDYKEDEIKKGLSWLKDTEWYINRKDNYSFVAKGGYNDEPHNHNDIGSFIVEVGDELILTDLGCGEYVKETFQPETRYTFPQNSSRGHSVPIINGEYQLYGKEYKAKNVKATENGFSLDIESAYRSGLIEKLARSFTLEDNKVILKDSFILSDETKSFTERLVSRVKPEILDGYVDFGKVKVYFDKEKISVSVNTETYISHKGNIELTFFETDFELKDIADGEAVLEIVI